MAQSLQKWHRFTLLEKMVFHVTDSGESTLIMDMVDETDVGQSVVTLEFRDVRNLRLAGFGGGITQVCGLTAEAIETHLFDSQRFRIHDAEDDRIEFTCLAFEGFDWRRSN